MSFSDLRYLIADEADTLFDDGFGPELRKLVLSVKVWACARPWRLWLNVRAACSPGL